MNLLDENEDTRIIPIEPLKANETAPKKRGRPKNDPNRTYKKRSPNKKPENAIKQVAINRKKRQVNKMGERIIEILPLVAEKLVDQGLKPFSMKNEELLNYFSTGFKEIDTPASTEIYASKDNDASPNQPMHSKLYERSINNPWTENSIRKSQMDELVIAPIQYDFMQSPQVGQGIYGGYGTLY
jgi:hypothetical protein